MIDTKEIQGGIVDAVAAARDEALVEMGRKAALRQERRHAELRHSGGGALVMAAVAAGAALAAGAVVYQARKRKNGKHAAAPNGHPVSGNGTVSEHEHAEEMEEELVSRR